MSSTSSSRMSSKVKKILKRIGIGLGIFVILLVVAVEVLLQTGALTGLVRNIASDYVDGELRLGRLTGSIVTHFPKARLVLEDVAVTYPHDKFAYGEGVAPDLRFTEEGRAAAADTLLSCRTLDVTVAWMDLIGGSLTVKEALLDEPRFFYHDFGSRTNLDVFGGSDGPEPEKKEEPAEEQQEEDASAAEESSSGFPVSVGNLRLTGRPHVVYTSAPDDLYVAADFDRMEALTDADGQLQLRIDGDAMLAAVGYELRGARLELSGNTFHRYAFGCDSIPAFDLTFRLPRAGLWHEGMSRQGSARFTLRAGKRTPAGTDLQVDSLRLRADGLRADLMARMEDVFGADPLMAAKGTADACVDSLGFLIPSDMDIDGEGTLALWIDGSSRLSDLDAVRYPNARIQGNLAVRGLRINDRTDDMRVYLPQADVDIRTMENTLDKTIPQGTQVLGLSAAVDTVHFRYGAEMEARGKGLSLMAQNSVLRYGANGPMGSFTPFLVSLQADRFGYKDGADLLVGVRGTDNSFSVSSDSVDRQLPRITLTSVSDRIFLREGVSRYMIRNTDLQASAKFNIYERQRRRARRDSLRRKRMEDRPEWLTTAEFKSSDIAVELDDDIKGYLRDWDVDGHARVGGGRVVTPYFRTRTVIDTLAADFSLDEVKVHDAQVHAGESQIGVEGSVRNLRHAVMGHGPYVLDFTLSSDRLNIDSLMYAAAAGQDYDVQALRDSMSVVTVDDDTYERLVVADSLVQDLPELDLFVVPANIVGDLVIYANNVHYGNVDISTFSGDAHIKQRIIQITNVAGQSNLGNFFLDAFYGTQSMQDIGAGADLTLYGMDADVLSDSFPELFDYSEGYVDRLSGDVEAQLAAVTRFDPQLNTDLMTTNGVIRVTGGYGNATEGSRHRLVIHNGPELKSIARWLPFISRHKIPITTLEANALIEEGQLEILPMLIRNDWYTVSIAGVQNVDPDEAFKYTVSIVHSPLLVPFGINLVGENFDDFDFDLVKSKYRRTRQIPRLDSRQKVQDAVDRLSISVADVYRLGIGGVIAAANPSRSFIELKQEGNYEFALLVDELDETDEAALRAMQDTAEEISADDFADRELTRLRKEVMEAKKEDRTDE